jgi:hypothetical protein
MFKLTVTKKDFEPGEDFKSDMKELLQLAEAASGTATWQVEDGTLIIEFTSADPLAEFAEYLKGALSQDGSEAEIVLEEYDAQAAT